MDVPLEVLVHIVAVDEPGDASDPQVSSWLGATAAAAVGHGAGIARRELQRGTRRWADGQVSAGRPLHLGFARRFHPPCKARVVMALPTDHYSLLRGDGPNPAALAFKVTKQASEPQRGAKSGGAEWPSQPSKHTRPWPHARARRLPRPTHPCAREGSDGPCVCLRSGVVVVVGRCTLPCHEVRRGTETCGQLCDVAEGGRAGEQPPRGREGSGGVREKPTTSIQRKM